MKQDKTLKETLDERSEDIDKRIRAAASAANLSVNDLYNLVFRQYKTDNALREEANKNANLVIAEKRIQLDGKRFLIEDYLATKQIKKIQRKQARKLFWGKLLKRK